MSLWEYESLDGSVCYNSGWAVVPRKAETSVLYTLKNEATKEWKPPKNGSGLRNNTAER